METLLKWLYGKSSKNKHIRELAIQLIEILKNNQMEYQELSRKLGIWYDKYKQPKRTFYFIVNPLKAVRLVQEKRVEENERMKTIYFLTLKEFRGYMISQVDEMVKQVES